MKNHLLWRLLRQNISWLQLIGFGIANFIGALIILLGVQTYRDMTDLLSAPDSFLKSDYWVISKKIDGLSSLGSLVGLSHKNFSESEIQKLKSQSGIQSVGAFTSSQFDVYGTVELGGARMSTEMFLESVPDAYLDLKPQNWSSTPDTTFVPVIIPRNYLNLYNYGFATSRGLPLLSENMMGSFPFRLRLSGQGQTRWYQARIVGFSNRLNTILVPDEFLQAANLRYAGITKTSPTRLILEVSADSDASLSSYLDKHQYMIEGRGADTLRTLHFVNLVTGFIVGFGILISFLAFIILSISIHLLIQKNRDKITTLRALGYPSREIARPYQQLTLAINGIVWLVAAIFLMFIHPMYETLLQGISPGFESKSLGFVFFATAFFFFVFSVMNTVMIWRKLKG